MSLNLTTIEKFYKKNFSTRPMVVTPLQKTAWVKHLESQLQNIDAIECNVQQYQDNANAVFEFSVRDAEFSYYNNDHFSLELNEQDQLSIVHRHLTSSVGSDAEIVAFAKACSDKINQDKMQQIKRDKIERLKVLSVTAQIKKLAKQEKFDFAIEQMQAKVKVAVRLSDVDCLQMTIPKKQFKNALPKLEAAIRGVREVYQFGVRPQVKSTRYYSFDWIEYEKDT